jgi:hypothetical protein
VILGKVAGHADFPEGNAPYGEHDFGAFDHNEQRIFWKIDFYDPAVSIGRACGLPAKRIQLPFAARRAC